MNTEIGVVSDHTITDRMKHIIKFITLGHQPVLYQQTGLGMDATAGFTTVYTIQPHYQEHQ
ncbi:hypothetical protein CQW37_01776 [Bacteroides fragilis]|nr:hypothetical protein CQW37_01776 [Bacteroides fragilis]